MSKIIHTWKGISLIQQTVTLPTGQSVEHTGIHHPGAAVILPILDNGNIVIIRQFRPALGKWIYELPAGTMEVGESPLTCAQRELKEETGYQFETFQSLGQLTPLAGFCDEIQYLYVAKHAPSKTQLNCDDDEVIDVLEMTLAELEQNIKNDSITDAKTIACLSKAKLCGHI